MRMSMGDGESYNWFTNGAGGGKNPRKITQSRIVCAILGGFSSVIY